MFKIAAEPQHDGGIQARPSAKSLRSCNLQATTKFSSPSQATVVSCEYCSATGYSLCEGQTKATGQEIEYHRKYYRFSPM